MLSLTALLHTENDAFRLGRCLETVYPCDEIVVIDHGSSDGTLHVAREYGAKIIRAAQEPNADDLLAVQRIISTEWLICLDPRESLSEALAASLFEWKWNEVAGIEQNPYAILVREENEHGWMQNPSPQTRLVPAGWEEWHGRFPASPQSLFTLEGNLLRFAFP